MKSALKPESSVKIPLYTITAIAVVVQLICSVVHEILGHALAAVLLGGHLLHVSSVDADYSLDGLSMGAQRIVHAAGILMNFIFGFVVHVAAKGVATASANIRYFCWLLGHVNFFIGGGYMMALSFAGFGDVDAFVTDLPSPALWKTAFTAIGAAISFATLRHGLRTLDPFLGGDYIVRRKRGKALTLVPYVASGIVSVVAGLFNPVGMILVATSAAASSFGGQAFLAWMPAFVRARKSDEEAELVMPVHSVLWIAVGLIALIVDVAILGPGLSV
jgi:hypothetical protein